MANGGSITWRIALAGLETVKAGLASLGPAGASSLRQLDAATGSPTRGLNALRVAGRETGEALGGVAARAGPAGRVLGELGPMGMAAAVGLGALVAAGSLLARQAGEVLRYAASVTDAADRIGVSTTAVQVWAEAAERAGVDAATASRGVDQLWEGIGRVKAGVGDTRIGQAFAALGIDRDTVEGWRNAEEALIDVQAAMGRIPDQAERVRLAAAVGLGGMEPMLRRTAPAFAAVQQDMERTGQLMDAELVRRSDEADEQFRRLGVTLRTELAEAFTPVIDQAGAAQGQVQDLIGDLARLAAMTVTVVINVATRFDRGLDRIEGWNRAEVEFEERITDNWFGRATGLHQSARASLNQLNAPRAAESRNRRARRLMGDLQADADEDDELFMIGSRPTAAESDDARRSGSGWGRGSGGNAGGGGRGRGGGRGGGARGARRSGMSAEERAAGLAALDLRNRIALADAQGNEALEQQLRTTEAITREVEQRVRYGQSVKEATEIATANAMQEGQARRQIAEQTRAQAFSLENISGLRDVMQFDAEAEATAREEAAYWTDRQLNSEMELARLSGDGTRIRVLEREAALARIVAELRGRGESEADAKDRGLGELAAQDRAAAVGQWRDIFSDGLRGALSGERGWLEGYFESLFSRAADSLADRLSDVLFSQMSDGKGGGDWFSAAVSWGSRLIGGGTQTMDNPWGAPAAPMAALVGNLPGAGPISAAGSPSINYAPVINAPGADPAGMARVEALMRQQYAELRGRIERTPERTLEMIDRNHGRP